MLTKKRIMALMREKTARRYIAPFAEVEMVKQEYFDGLRYSEVLEYELKFYTEIIYQKESPSIDSKAIACQHIFDALYYDIIESLEQIIREIKYNTAESAANVVQELIDELNGEKSF
jgi:hypothetical protein